MMKLNDIKCLLPCLAVLIAGSVIISPSSTTAVALPQSGNSGAPLLSSIVLTDSWPIERVVAIRSGALVFAGGDFLGGADGLVLVAPDKFVKLAALGDPVPGRDGLFLAQVGFGPSMNDFSLNNRGELAFVADVVNCNPASQIVHCSIFSPFGLRQGIFLFSETSRSTIALQGDPAPGSSGGTFQSFNRIWLTDQGTVFFQAWLTLADGTRVAGLFSFSQNRIDKIVMPGDVTPIGTMYSGPIRASLRASLNDDGALLFDGYFLSGGFGILRYENGQLSKILSSSDAAPWGGTLGRAYAWNAASRGAIVVNAGDSLYLRGSDGVLSRIVKAGDNTPIGGQFGEFVLTAQISLQTYMTPVEPLVDGSGDVMFKPPPGQGLDGIFLISRGTIEKVVADFDPVPGHPQQVMFSSGFDMNNLGIAAFSATIGTPAGLALFSYNKGNIFSIYLPGDAAPPAEAGNFKDLKEFFVDDTGDVLFHATLCCGRYKEGIFRASYPRAVIPNGSFESLGDNGLPANWQSTWSSSGNLEASQFNCGSDCASDGSSVMRLHVPSGGGATFVVSDPISVAPEAVYVIAAQMRYYLNSDSDRVYFTIIQSDSAGDTVGFDEVTGIRGDNAWRYVPKGMMIRTKPGASSIRIRLGLVANTETYIDVDSVR